MYDSNSFKAFKAGQMLTVELKHTWLWQVENPPTQRAEHTEPVFYHDHGKRHQMHLWLLHAVFWKIRFIENARKKVGEKRNSRRDDQNNKDGCDLSQVTLNKQNIHSYFSLMF